MESGLRVWPSPPAPTATALLSMANGGMTPSANRSRPIRLGARICFARPPELAIDVAEAHHLGVHFFTCEARFWDWKLGPAKVHYLLWPADLGEPHI